MPTAPAERPATPLGLLTVVMAVTCGFTVANLYYAQPLLDLMARDLHVNEGSASLVVTLTQVGYAIGLLLVLPLADLWENRRLICWTLLGTAVSLVGAGLAPGLGLVVVLSALVGLTSVVAQVVVPFAANLAPEGRSGRVVGQVMLGLILGILLARTLASFVAAALGWRAIFFISAGIMLVLSVLLRCLLPERRPATSLGYLGTLASVGRILVEEPVLRRRAASQALVFGGFTAFWTAIVFHLSAQFGLGQQEIGLFALVGAGGALAAPVAGRLGDAGHGHVASGVVLTTAIVGIAVTGLVPDKIVALAAGAILLDFAVQGHQVLSQHEIYGLRDDARARITTVYMTSVFSGGALSSAVTGWVYERHGWGAVCAFGAALPALALVVWCVHAVRRRRPAAMAAQTV